MQSLVLDRKTGGTVTIDLCSPCQALWLDAFESVQLTPGAVVALFGAIHAARPDTRRPLPASLPCPRCNERLVLTHDQTTTAHFTYYRCPYRHGRLTPFVQFLREKSFVRVLPPAELEELKAHVRVIHCSSCGAPVDLEADTACPFCRAPIVALDPHAVETALARYRAAEDQRTRIDPVALVDGLLQARSVHDDERPGGSGTGAASAVVDLVGLGLDALHALLARA